MVSMIVDTVVDLRKLIAVHRLDANLLRQLPIVPALGIALEFDIDVGLLMLLV